MVTLLIILVGAIVCGILYRCGGAGKPYDTKYRDIGCPITMLVVMALLGKWHWSLIPSAFLLYGALTTYHKWLNRFFNKPNLDSFWFNWAMTGFCYGLSLLPYAIATNCWIGFSSRIISLTVFTTVVSEFFDNAFFEEFSRGFLICATLIFI